jgi:hypothetical protein
VLIASITEAQHMRLRSRWLKIAAFAGVLLIVGGGWWFSRPNLDPRFVGDWEYYAVKDVAPDDAYTEPDPVVLKLSADGSADSRVYKRLGFTLVDWWVDRNGHLVLVANYYDQRPFLWQLKSRFSRVANEFQNAQVERWIIDKVANGRIAMRRFGDTNAHLMLKRVSLADSGH